MIDSLSVLSDAPSDLDDDRLEFRRYVVALTQVIMSEATQTPFTIGVFGAWGSGKSSLLEMIDQSLADNHADKVVRVRFNPWIHRREPNMLLPLLLTLQGALAEDRKQRFTAVTHRIGGLLVKLSAGVLLGRLSGGGVTLEGINQLAQEYAAQRSQVDSQTRNLRATLQEQADAIRDNGARLVFFIDDLDRCQPAEIIDLLESVKLFLDLRNVFIIIAIAKDIVEEGIAFKYRDFGFSGEKVLTIADEYLDKMIQLPLYLPPIDTTAVGEFMAGFELSAAVRAQLDLLEKIVSPNPRRIKRVLNTCAVTLAITQQSAGLRDLRQDLIARLTVLRIQSADLYAEITRRPSLLVALELAYQRKLDPRQTDRFVQEFGTEQADSMQRLVSRFYRSQAYLEYLFSESAFDDIKDDLPRYLTMLGGTQ
jgi:hypothetical protein